MKVTLNVISSSIEPVLELQNPRFSCGQMQKCNNYTLQVSKFSKHVNEEQYRLNSDRSYTLPVYKQNRTCLTAQNEDGK